MLLEPLQHRRRMIMKADHQKVANLMKTARGQIDGILRMIEDDRYCMDVAHQIMAAEAILRREYPERTEDERRTEKGN